MRVWHVVNESDGVAASGVGTFIRGVNEELLKLGVASRVFTEQIVLKSEAELPDIVHIHGLWLGIQHYYAKWAKTRRLPIVWSTHGMTAPWAMHHKWWKKLLAWLLYQKRDLKSAAAIHCTTELEVGWNKSLGFNNCFIAPLGTNENQFHTPTLPSTPTHNSNYTLLFVGRIYPVKGLVNLIKAWKILHDSTCSTWLNWKLRIVGPDQAGHQFELESLVRELGLCDSVEFPGPKFGEELSAEYNNCDCLVLPSFTENFGATVVDAMAHGKPVITSSFTPWKIVQESGCGWWVSNEPDKLAEAIRGMIDAGDVKRCEMGRRGRRLVEEKYTWSAVGKTMKSAYERLLA